MKISTLTRILICPAALLFAFCVNAQNIVNDPGFEASADGNGPHPFSAAWTVVDPSGNQPPGVTGSNSNVGGDSAFAHTGNNYANLGAVGQLGTLSQSLVTVPGQMYTLSFWLANDGTVPPNSFTVMFGGATVASMTNAATSPYTQFTFSNLMASGASTLLSFQYRNDDDFFRLDDVSVSAAGVPDSGTTLWMVAPVMGLLCALHVVATRRSARFARI